MKIYILIILLLVPFVSAEYDPACVSDSDCWFKSLVDEMPNDQNTICNNDCAEYHGPNSLGSMITGECHCACKPGYEEDETLTCVRSETGCNQDCKEYHSRSIYGHNAYGEFVDGVCQCKCKEGYVPDETLKCVEEFSESDFDDVNLEDEFDESDFEDIEQPEAAWETFQDKCKDLREFTRGAGGTFTVTQQEYIEYITRVEEANPNHSWKTILAALHVNRYPDDAFNQRLPLFGNPLFEHGPETDDWREVDLLCQVNLSGNTQWYTPKFVLTDEGRKIEIGHAYGGLRVLLNRKSTMLGKTTEWIYGRDVEKDLWVMLLTHYGDAWQVLIHNIIMQESGSRAPPDQVFGNNMGIWLAGYYRKNPDASLSQAFQDYFNR